LTCDEIYFDQPLIAYGRTFEIQGVDKFTQDYYLAKHHRHFPIGEIEQPKPRPAVVV
jgi:hypothetical protein